MIHLGETPPSRMKAPHFHPLIAAREVLKVELLISLSLWIFNYNFPNKSSDYCRGALFAICSTRGFGWLVGSVVDCASSCQFALVSDMGERGDAGGFA
jgi:hypothetical protein